MNRAVLCRALFALLFYLAGFQSISGAEIEFIENSNGNRCELSGQITEGDAEKFQEVISNRYCVLSLDSPGGSFSAALEIIEQMGSSTPTIVVSGNRCLSACALIFMSGMYNEDGAYARRSVEPGGIIGFHRPSLDLDKTKGDVYPAESIERAFSKSIDIINILIKRSNKRFHSNTTFSQYYYFPPILLNKMLNFEGKNFYYLSTVGDLLISGVYLFDFLDFGIEEYAPSGMSAYRNVCENYFWQSIANFDTEFENFGVPDTTFFEEEFRGNRTSLVTIEGSEYVVFHDYPAPEGTYRDCYVKSDTDSYSVGFKTWGETIVFEYARGIFAFPRQASIKDITNQNTSLKLPAVNEFSNAVDPRSFAIFDNTDIDGKALRSFKGVDQNSCKDACKSSEGCTGYTFDKWNNWCFLKSSLRARLVNPKGVSGVEATKPIPPLSTSPLEFVRYRGKHFPGAGMLDRKAVSTDKCERICENTDSCIAYAHFRSENKCRLFSSVGEYFSHHNAVIGFRRQEH